MIAISLTSVFTFNLVQTSDKIAARTAIEAKKLTQLLIPEGLRKSTSVIETGTVHLDLLKWGRL